MVAAMVHFFWDLIPDTRVNKYVHYGRKGLLRLHIRRNSTIIRPLINVYRITRRHAPEEGNIYFKDSQMRSDNLCQLTSSTSDHSRRQEE